MEKIRKKRCLIHQKEVKTENLFWACRFEDYDNEFFDTYFKNSPVFKIILAKDVRKETGSHRSCLGEPLVIFLHEATFTDLCETLKGGGEGYLCLFEESFLSKKIRTNIQNLPMFISTSKSEYLISEEQYTELSGVFHRIIHELFSPYQFKYELIRTYITQVIHFGVRIEQSDNIIDVGGS